MKQRFLLAAMGVLGACSNGGGPDAGLPDAQLGPWLPFASSSCNARQREVPLQAGIHYEPASGFVPAYYSNPPASGPHCPVWARWGVWDAIPRCNWIHNLEHAGVVMLYPCPGGSCTQTRDALAAVVSSLPDDPLCTPTPGAPAKVRVVVTRDDAIETPIAAAAWGWVYAADCVEPATLRQFYLEHFGHTVENFCAEGSVP